MQSPVANAPSVTLHNGILVVRDDLLHGGTKARYLVPWLRSLDEDVVIAACSSEGGTQASLAIAAEAVGKKAVIFLANRKRLTGRTLQAQAHGARLVFIKPGYSSNVRFQARAYALQNGYPLMPIVLPNAAYEIANAAHRMSIEPPSVVWCAGGNGTLARGLMCAWPQAELHVVEIGKPIQRMEIPWATIVKSGVQYSKEVCVDPGFPIDRIYEAKAWSKMMASDPVPGTVFWNSMAPANLVS